jgi:hypothetical protein
MAANTDLIVTGLDFDTIRGNLRNFIAAKPEFTDYDFADSALGTLLDLLAYNTYYQSFYANMSSAEGFLDSAQLYDSVVSRAKALGYTPTSARGAQANVQLVFTNSFANNTFRSIRIPKDTKFTTSVNGTSYIFVTPQTYTVSANSGGGFDAYVKIVEGQPLTHKYTFNRLSNTSFVIPNAGIDTTSVSVSVSTNGTSETYVKADDILIVNSSSKVFFVEADRDEKFKIAFGDGVLGKQPATSSIVSVSYRVCNGEFPNGATNFSLTPSTIDSQSGIYVSSIGRAIGGAKIESIESVRFNAPRLYETQNRTVTQQDFERIILRDYADIQAVRVWGGEENEPPIYGKVFVSAKPKNGTLLSSVRKNDIRLSLRRYNVQSIDVELVDPTYLYIVPSINVRYNTTKTTKTAGELAALISDRVVLFEQQNLSRFGQNFRYSKFLEYIDTTDDAIETTTIVIRLRKTFSPSTSALNSYVARFNNSIQRLGTKELADSLQKPGFGTLTSSSFTYAGKSESYLDDTGYGTIRTYYKSTVGTLGRTYTNYNTGTVDYDAGIVRLNSFQPSAFSGETMSIVVAPSSPNISPIRNQILLMSQCEVNMIDDVTGKTLATASNIETIGQTSTLLTPSGKLYTF